MNSFEWVDATSVEHAAALLAEGSVDEPVVAKAGGMDLVDLMKEAIIRPSRVVNLKSREKRHDPARITSQFLPWLIPVHCRQTAHRPAIPSASVRYCHILCSRVLFPVCHLVVRRD
jgi:hypothetical protein